MLAQVVPSGPVPAAFALMGSQVEPLVEDGDTAGAYELVRTTVGPQGRSPLHTMGTDKVFLVLDGAITIDLDGTEHPLSGGAVVHVPAGTAHRYRNDSGSPATLLVLTSGLGHVAFLRGMSALTAGGPPEPDALAAHTREHGVRLLPVV